MGGESVGRSRRRDAKLWREAKRRGGVVRGVVWRGAVCCCRWAGGRVGDVTPLGWPLQPRSSRSLYSWRGELVEEAPRDAAKRGGGPRGSGGEGERDETERRIRKRQIETGVPARRRYRLFRALASEKHLAGVTFHHAAARVSLAKISPFNTFEIFRLQFHFDRYEKCTLPSDTLLKRYFTTSTMLRRITETAAGARGRSQDFIGNLFCLSFGHGDLLRPLHGIGHLLLMLQCHAIIIASSSHSIVRSHGTRAKQKVKDSPLAPGTEALARLSRSTSSRFPSATVMGKILEKCT
ncbi:hypothetical protein ALC60_00704 [Trachymyrmex zeteki]|uniref:Uncharacterized protein n=1 Tax=Mycetomoellerius zeteki TaxID=64791 RepID=A0A151XIR5_9HYME|nr:hypothetical protein ALC60_00704 [Trachymyrmex zeteki]